MERVKKVPRCWRLKKMKYELIAITFLILLLSLPTEAMMTSTNSNCLIDRYSGEEIIEYLSKVDKGLSKTFYGVDKREHAYINGSVSQLSIRTYKSNCSGLDFKLFLSLPKLLTVPGFYCR